MRRFTYIAIVFAALLLATPTKAQFCWGVKGGVSLGELPNLESEGQTLKLDNYAGFFVGPKIEARIPIIGLGLEVAAMYAQKNISSTSKQDYLQLPVNIKYSFGLGNKANFFLAVGPEFGFNITKIAEGYNIKNTPVDLNAGLGVTLFKHVQVAANYNMPWRDKIYYKSGIMQFSLAYLF